MKTIRETKSLRAELSGFAQDGESVALVPTMGSLHQGHMELARLASEYAERVVVSVFVNPTQFGPQEDFENYPRTFDTDRRRLSRAGVDVMFAPTHDEIYPFGAERMTRVSVPGLSLMLCGERRPGHFDGVTSVVNRLFNIVRPEVAVFGQKDYQQLVIIRRMVQDLHMPIKILASPTQREKSGLALSSRNRYLTTDERDRAVELYATVCACRDQYLAGERDPATLEKTGFERLSRAGFEPDYLTIRKSGDLSLPDDDSSFLVVLAAAQLGKARLIDNVMFEMPG